MLGYLFLDKTFQMSLSVPLLSVAKQNLSPKWPADWHSGQRATGTGRNRLEEADSRDRELSRCAPRVGEREP